MAKTTSWGQRVCETCGGIGTDSCICPPKVYLIAKLTSRRLEDGAGLRDGHIELDVSITIAVDAADAVTFEQRASLAEKAIRDAGFGGFMTDDYCSSVGVIRG